MVEFTENVEGHPGYHVSKMGDVWSKHSGRWKLLTPNVTRSKKGFITNICVRLVDTNGKVKSYSLSRLIAHAYVPNPNNLKYVVHKDSNQMNNYYKNLEWSNNNQTYSTQRKGYERSINTYY